MKIEDIRIGMKLRNPRAGRAGKVIRIEKEGGLELASNGLSWNEHVENVEPVGELHIGDYVRATGKSTTFFEDVEGKVGIIDSFMNDVSGDKCADIRWLCGSSNLVKVAQLTPLARGEHFHCDHFRPLAEVAKCYIQVEPERLFLSQDAKRVIEFLTATDTPVAFWRIAEGMKDLVSGAAIIDGLIEAREAGIVRLDEGKYSLVRD